MTTEARKPQEPQWRAWVARLAGSLSGLAIPFLAVFTALLIGAVVIWASGASVLKAYEGLFEGALGSPRALAETFVQTTPYILAGLALTVGFRCGLFNIGVEGQFYIGALFAVFVGYAFIPYLPALYVLFVLDNVFFGFSLAVDSYFQKIAHGPEEITSNVSMAQTINHISALVVPILGGIL